MQSKTVEIPLGRKKEKCAIIDAHHFPLVSKFNWSLHRVVLKNGKVKEYARTWNKGKPFYMHRLIKNFPEFKIVDHKNGIGLINTDENLRTTNYSVNNYNCNKGRHGVYRAGWRWRAIIKDRGKGKSLGTFTSYESAKEAMAEVRAQLIEASERDARHCVTSTIY